MNYQQVKKVLKKVFVKEESQQEIIEKRINKYRANGGVPWSEGYEEFKWQQIGKTISDEEIIGRFSHGNLPKGFGIGLDERIIEYPWLFSKLPKTSGTFLDAGSTFNFEVVLMHPSLTEKQKYIYTYYPEDNNFAKKRISYVYGDLRNLPFKDEYFNFTVCQSTLEHIDMDNSIYGYTIQGDQNTERKKSYKYLEVIDELIRVTTRGGKLLITFPYGKFENHGFFQQFDEEMVMRIEQQLQGKCSFNKNFMLYDSAGWQFRDQQSCNNTVSYNPHTGVGKGTDNAAHCRAICLIEANKF